MQKISYFRHFLLQMHQHLNLHGHQPNPQRSQLVSKFSIGYHVSVCMFAANSTRVEQKWYRLQTQTHIALVENRSLLLLRKAVINADFGSLMARISLNKERQIWPIFRLVVACCIALWSPKISCGVCTPHSVIRTSADTLLNHSRLPLELLKTSVHISNRVDDTCWPPRT